MRKVAGKDKPCGPVHEAPGSGGDVEASRDIGYVSCRRSYCRSAEYLAPRVGLWGRVFAVEAFVQEGFVGQELAPRKSNANGTRLFIYSDLGPRKSNAGVCHCLIEVLSYSYHQVLEAPSDQPK